MDQAQLLSPINREPRLSNDIQSSYSIRHQGQKKLSLDKSGSKNIQQGQFERSGSLFPSNLSIYSICQLQNILLSSVQNSEVLEVRSMLNYLRGQDKPSLKNIADAKSYTLVHIVCYNNQPAILEMLLNYEKEASRRVDEWLAMKNQDTFTALHFAAYRGSIRNLQILLEHGASINEENGQGQNAMSIAAQGDQVNAMVWLRQRSVLDNRIQGLGIQSLDAKGGTPLHWASYYGSEFAANLLLAWLQKHKECGKPIINIQDQDGMTALHLASLSGNIKIAKKLLLRGADRELKDGRGQTPSELALENQFENIHKLLRDSNGLLEFLNIRTKLEYNYILRFKEATKSVSQIVMFFLLYIFCLAGTVAFCFPYMAYDWFLIFTCVMLLSGMLFYSLTSCIGPGHVTIQTGDDELLALFQQHEPWEVCAECTIYKPKRSRHCEYCRKCIIVYDHHCPWLNNCIGAKNHGIFLTFLFVLWLNLIHIGVLNGYYLDNHHDINKDSLFFWGSDDYPMGVYYTKLVVQAIVLLICAVFLFPLSILTYYQTNNFLFNKTTLERFKDKLKANKRSSQQSVTSNIDTESHRSCSNCYEMCCLNYGNPTYDYKKQ